ncbi:hypothetical protein D3C76_1098940 [compost metagenome]
MRATALHRLFANRPQQPRPEATALHVRLHHQVVHVNKAPVEQVFHLAVTGQADNLLTLPRGQQAVALPSLPKQLLHIAVPVSDMRAQFAHEVETRLKPVPVFEVLQCVLHSRRPL